MNYPGEIYINEIKLHNSIKKDPSCLIRDNLSPLENV